MISDSERREVANEIRRQALYTRGTPGDWWMRLHETVTGEDDFPAPQETMNAIADLIDRPTCHISERDHEFEDSVRCDRCQVTFSRPWEPFKYCPNCGAEVIDD